MLHNSQKDFLKRHIGPSEEDQLKMLKKLNYKSLDDLIDSTVPEKIQFKGELNIGESNSEYEALRKLKAISKQNKFSRTGKEKNYRPSKHWGWKAYKRYEWKILKISGNKEKFS